MKTKKHMYKSIRGILGVFLSCLLFCVSSVVSAQNSLKNMSFSSMPGDKIQIKMDFSEMVPDRSPFF